MRVLVTADTFSGVWTYSRELVSGLVTHGAQVTLVSFGHMPEPRQLALALLVDHLGDKARASAMVEPFMSAVVANFGNEWEMSSADIDQALAALSGRAVA